MMVITVCENANEIIELRTFYDAFPASCKNGLVFNFDEGKYYKVEFDHKLIGFASIVGDDFSILDFRRFIHPDFRNNKIGEKLLDYIIQDAKNAKKTRLIGYLRSKNEKSVAFFQSKGFEIAEGEDVSMVILKLR